MIVSLLYLSEEKMKLDSYLKLYIKVNSQWIMAVNKEGKSIKFLQKIGYFFLDLEIGKDFLNLK